MDKQLLETIKNEIRATIEVVVNGKIDKIKIHLEEIEKKIDDLKPLNEAQQTIANLRKFFIWIAAPVTIIAGAIKFLWK